ncbi:MAG: hypothetical protein AAGA60_17365 [Cyanobacteria bacterium P01_E01_bin.42]
MDDAAIASLLISDRTAFQALMERTTRNHQTIFIVRWILPNLVN